MDMPNANAQRAAGPWSVRYRARLRAWEEHLERRYVGGATSWAQDLLHWKGTKWIREQRIRQGSASRGGRTETRVAPGPPAKRWHESIAELREAGSG